MMNPSLSKTLQLLATIWGLAILSGGLVAAADTGTPDSTPLLSVEPDSLHWNDVFPGEVYEGFVTVSNFGARDIRLYYIFAECDCTLRHPQEGLVPAGGQFVLPITMEVPENQDTSIEEKIEMLTDLESQPSLLLPVTASLAETDHSVAGF